MEELKVGDKINIKCESGKVHELCISANGQKIDNVTSMQITADPKRGLRTILSLITPNINLKNVAISEIIDSNPKINEIKGIFEDYHREMEDKKNPSKKDVLEEIANIIYR